MKKIIISILVLMLLIIAGTSVYNMALPDYVKHKEIFKGYTDSDGHSYAGKDLDEYYVYYYTDEQKELFVQSELYTRVDDSNIEVLKAIVEKFDEYSDVESFSNTISIGDYYILNCFDSDGKKIDYNDENYQLYFFDTDSQKLHYLYQVL